MEGEALRAQQSDDFSQRVIDSVSKATRHWAAQIIERVKALEDCRWD
jgi:hypothetical protein